MNEFYIYLEGNKTTDFEIDTCFSREGNYKLGSILVKIWNFKFQIQLPK